MGGKKILVVDDERDMRIFVSTVVETLGFEPIAAENGSQALDMAGTNPPVLVILDVMMPKMNGKEAFAEIQKMNPEMKALFMSGYTADIIRRKGIHEEGLNFINKPISPYDLQRKIIEILNN